MGFWQNEKIERQAAEIERLERQIINMDEMLYRQGHTIKRLRAALKPFAETGECESASFSYSYLRAAADALKETGDV